MRLTIDHQTIDVEPGTTVLQAAALLGIDIPTMCFLEAYNNHPSCMVCQVQDAATGKYFPSCAMPVAEGMEVIATSAAIDRLRRDALELMHSDHAGDCEAPCRLSCPAFMDIPQMNRLIAAGETGQALALVREEIALPLILGYICQAPCEKACHRGSVDQPVAICMLKRFTASELYDSHASVPPPVALSDKKVAVIGSGPAGLSAAWYLNRLGYGVTVFEASPEPGGTLRYAIGDDILPRQALDAEIGFLKRAGIAFMTSCAAGREKFETEIMPVFDAVVLATGHRKDHPIESFVHKPLDEKHWFDPHTGRSARQGVVACGSVIREQSMAVRSAAQGKAAAMEVHRYLNPQAHITGRIHFNSALGKLHPDEAEEMMKEGSPLPRVEPAGGWLQGFGAKEARAEAARCMHCDCRSRDDCKLRLLSEAYQAKRRVFRDAGRPLFTREVRHEVLVWEPGKCIKCGLCVSITRQEMNAPGLTFIGRGFDVRIAVPFDGAFGEALKHTALKCAEACPTGALAAATKGRGWSPW